MTETRENELETEWRTGCLQYAGNLTACQSPESQLAAAKVMMAFVLDGVDQDQRQRRMDCLAHASRSRKLNGEQVVDAAIQFEAFLLGV